MGFGDSDILFSCMASASVPDAVPHAQARCMGPMPLSRRICWSNIRAIGEIGPMDELQRWLAAVGLEQLAPVFKANDVDLDVVADLTDADLEKIGISLGLRR